MVARRNSVLAFLGWSLVGAAGAVGLLTLTVPGLLVSTLLGAAAVVVFVRLEAPFAAAGVIVGGAAAALYVGWLNRQGPGEHCRTFADGGQECTQMWSPWPWLILGLALAAGAIALYVRARRRRPLLDRPAARLT